MDIKNIYAILIYFIIIYAVGIILTLKDKNAAVRGKWRVQEKTLLIVGLLGAALPVYITMKLVHHKTKHPKFMLGLPAEALLHVILIAAVILKIKGFI